MYFNFENEDKFVVIPRKRKSYNSFGLRLTPMIDMFTILLVFLLKSFSAEGEIMTVAKDMHLPESTAKTPPKSTPILMITNEWIILDGNPVEEVSHVAADQNIVIERLLRQLQNLRVFSERLGALDANMGFKGNITIQGDKEIPFQILKKVMFTCGQVGFNNMLLAVNQEE
ncbi:MAG: ExbD/TolR family protein [bacterium]